MVQPIRIFGIIGGDKRQLYLAQSLLEDGYDIILAGFDKLSEQGLSAVSGVETAICYSDAVLLPVPSLRADNSLNAPLSAQPIVFSEKALEALCQKPVFAAGSSRLLRAYPKLEEARVFDYAAREDFCVRNALPTAEGAAALAMRAYEGTVFGSRALITGFGRIGKQLAKLLTGIGASVTVCARKPSDLAMIETLGYRAKPFADLKDTHGYALIFNTVPALIFDRKLLQETDPSAVLIDLASLPGGVDFEAARLLGINAHRALGLPGKCAPKSAGEIIKTTVLSLIEEVKR